MAIGVSQMKEVLSKKDIQAYNSLWNSGMFLSYIIIVSSLIFTEFATKYLMFFPDMPNGDKNPLNVLLPTLTAIFGLVFCFPFMSKTDYKDSFLAGKPTPSVKTLASAFLLVLTLIIQSNQENNIASIVVTFGFGLLIFCFVRKICPVTDFGLFEFFINKSVGIIANIYGLKSFQTMGFSIFCLFLLGLHYLMEVQEKNSNAVTGWCFMDVSIGKIPEGRIVFELFEKSAPETVKNFKSFCREGHYKKTIFHHINSHSTMIGGEELSSVNDSGTIEKVECKYDLHHSAENSRLEHEKAGLLSTPMNTKGSMFLITMDSYGELNSTSMVFGKIVKGIGLLEEIKKVAVDNEFRPIQTVEIVDCGVISKGAYKDDFCNLFGEKDQYPDWPQQIAEKEKEFDWWLAAVGSLQILGSVRKKMRKYERAVVKYKKALRYLEVCCTGELVYKPSGLILEEFKYELSKELDDCLLKLGVKAGAEQVTGASEHEAITAM